MNLCTPFLFVFLLFIAVPLKSTAQTTDSINHHMELIRKGDRLGIFNLGHWAKTNSQALKALSELAKEGFDQPLYTLLNLAEEGNKKAWLSVKDLMREGNEKAFDFVLELSLRRNKRALETFTELASQGNKKALGVLLSLNDRKKFQLLPVIEDLLETKPEVRVVFMDFVLDGDKPAQELAVHFVENGEEWLWEEVLAAFNSDKLNRNSQWKNVADLFKTLASQEGEISDRAYQILEEMAFGEFVIFPYSFEGFKNSEKDFRMSYINEILLEVLKERREISWLQILAERGDDRAIEILKSFVKEGVEREDSLWALYTVANKRKGLALSALLEIAYMESSIESLEFKIPFYLSHFADEKDTEVWKALVDMANGFGDFEEYSLNRALSSINQLETLAFRGNRQAVKEIHAVIRRKFNGEQIPDLVFREAMEALMKLADETRVTPPETFIIQDSQKALKQLGIRNHLKSRKTS